MAGSGVRLRSDEAVPLAHALVARAAQDLGLRALAIKGPVVAMQGLREPRTSADLDVLVHPRDLEPLLDGLVALGWRRGVEGTYAWIMPPHSVNLLSDLWPIGMDIHHYFPGFLADAGEVFDVLWARHEMVPLAGVPVPACDRVGQAAVMALHHLRVSPDGDSAPLADLAEHARDALSAEDVRALVQLAHETDATATLRPFLLTLGVPEEEIGPARDAEALDTWNRRVRAVGYEAWFMQFAQTPKRQWPRTLWHALMLTDDEIYVYSNVAPGSGGLARLRLRRIRRGVGGRAADGQGDSRSAAGDELRPAPASAGTTIASRRLICSAAAAFAARPRRYGSRTSWSGRAGGRWRPTSAISSRPLSSLRPAASANWPSVSTLRKACGYSSSRKVR